MERYGAEVVPVTTGSATLKDAVNEALRDWAASFPTTHYLLGSALGPSPYPDMVDAAQGADGSLQDFGGQVLFFFQQDGGQHPAIGFGRRDLEDVRDI